MRPGLRRGLAALPVALALALAGPAQAEAQAENPAGAFDAGEAVIVALADRATPPVVVGGTPRAGGGYQRGAGYAAGLGTEAEAEALAREHGLRAESAWTIAPLKLHCILFRLAAGADRTQLLARLAADPRVQLAQPLNAFETLAAPANTPEPAPAAYNDPYLGLQRGFAALSLPEAQRWTRGEGVRIALIDTGLDGEHPDLQGRVAAQRDLVGPAHPPPSGGERHGTQMAGVIAAVANNRQGIVGVAPQARLLALRACWESEAGGAARCDSFTLARALGAAIAAEPDLINLSLGGPPDPLLARLTAHALSRGIVVVGAVPPATARLAQPGGFPAGVPGVLAVRSSDDAAPAGAPPALAAPGRDILTLSPGGGYDYASGSSLAAAQVSGAVALLRALQPRLGGEQARRWLAPTDSAAAVNACAAVRQLRADAQCDAPR